ncbi:unnamed protein product [Withania somnifera]
MGCFKSTFIFLFLLVVAQLLLFTHSEAATFNIRNNCPYTVWAASVPVGGGRQLNAGQTWTINVPAGTKQARIWARTGCNFDGSGRGRCQAEIATVSSVANLLANLQTLWAEYAPNQFNNLDFFDISLVDGFNVPLEFGPTSNGCTRGISVFKTDQYCCNCGNCGPTRYSKYFKNKCPDAYSYPKDDQTSTFTCPGGTNYRVVFCP